MSKFPLDPEPLILRVRDCLARHYSGPDRTTLENARFANRQLAAYVLSLRKHESGHPILHSLYETAVMVWDAGVHLPESAEEDVKKAAECLRSGWPGIIAATLLIPSWRATQLPGLDGVPTWLWAHYARWILASPLGAVDRGISSRNARHIADLVTSVARWTERNVGSTAVRSAIGEILRVHPAQQLLASNEDLSSLRSALGKIIARAGSLCGSDDYVPLPRTEAGRIRVGFLFSDLQSSAETRTARAYLQHLDPTLFEMVLIAPKVGQSEFENHFCQLAASVITLKGDLPAVLAMIREADLDIAVVVPDRSMQSGEWIELGCRRLGRITSVFSAASFLSGLPGIDTTIVGSEIDVDSAASCEQLAILTAPGYVHEPGQLPSLEPEALALLRTSVELPSGIPVFVATADLSLFDPATLDAWARILREVPAAYFIWALPPNTPRQRAKFTAQTFCFASGIDPARLILHFDERRSTAALAQVHLSPLPTPTAAEISLAIGIGIAPLCLSSTALHRQCAPAMLRDCGLSHCVAVSVDEYVQKAVSFATVEGEGAKIRQASREAIVQYPLLTDTLGRSDAFAAMLLRMHDLAQESGSLPMQKEPIRLAPLPASVEDTLRESLAALDRGDTADAIEAARTVLSHSPFLSVGRHLLGRAYSAAEHPDKALPYFLAALQGQEQSADLWFETASVLHATGCNQQAIEALEASLRLDATQVPAWHLLAKLAREVGHQELVEETESVLKSLQCVEAPAN